MSSPLFEGLTTIGQINIPVHDLDLSVEFYRESFGMKFLFQVPGMAFFDCDGIRILLAVPEDAVSDHPSSIIYFRVEDIHFAADTLRARGVQLTREPHLIAEMPDHDLWMSFFVDPDGNTLGLMSEIPKPDRLAQGG